MKHTHRQPHQTVVVVVVPQPPPSRRNDDAGTFFVDSLRATSLFFLYTPPQPHRA
jgi:hypothetical protein